MLNLEQQQVVDSDASKLLVLAGAGAGKTHTMLERISRLINDGVQPESILVLTFTNAAAFEMKTRYKDRQDGHGCPEFRTFHSFCYHLLIIDRNIREHLGYTQVPKVVSEAELKRIETTAQMQCNLHVSQDKLAGKTPCSPRERQQIAIYKKALKLMLKKQNIITFDILATEVSELFISRDSLTCKYIEKYKYIFVDEFQDTDPQQIKFLKAFENSNFCCVGDALQNIYQFRNCTNDTIKKLASDNNWHKIKMYHNYRSTNQICDFANNMSNYADPEYRIEMKGQRDGEAVKVIHGAYSNWQHVVCPSHCNMLLEMLKSGTSDHSVAVLCRTNKEVKYVCQVLKDNGILYSSGHRNDDALHILRSITDSEYMIDWLSSFLNADTYADYIRSAAQEENPDIQWFLKQYKDVADIKTRSNMIFQIHEVLNKQTHPMTKAADILNALGIKGLITNIEDDKDILPNLISIISSQGDQDIYVGTIHSSKGLEYDTVYLMGVGDTSFQLRSEEMYNLYYVAITRAKNNLIIFHA